jgi:hypothetical protein
MTTQDAIDRPAQYVPGTGGDLVSGEAAVRGFGSPPPDARGAVAGNPPTVCPAGCPGRRSGTARPRSASTCRTPGWWRTCPATGSASPPRGPDRPAGRGAGPADTRPGARRPPARLDGLVRAAAGRAG